MKKVILKVSIIILLIVIGSRVGLSYLVESARHDFENDKPCESYKVVKWSYAISKESKFILGKVLAQGVCVPQNIPRAIEVFEDVYDNNSALVAGALFNSGVQLFDYQDRNALKSNEADVLTLINESKKMGFSPSEKDLAKLSDRGLGELF